MVHKGAHSSGFGLNNLNFKLGENFLGSWDYKIQKEIDVHIQKSLFTIFLRCVYSYSCLTESQFNNLNIMNDQRNQDNSSGVNGVEGTLWPPVDFITEAFAQLWMGGVSFINYLFLFESTFLYTSHDRGTPRHAAQLLFKNIMTRFSQQRKMKSSYRDTVGCPEGF